MHVSMISLFLVYQDTAVESLTTVKPYSNEVHAQAQLWLKKDPKASYEAWKKCLPARSEGPLNTHNPPFLILGISELHPLEQGCPNLF